MSPLVGADELPSGVAISSSRETTQIDDNGKTEQGMLFTLTIPNAAPSSIFVPYRLMGDVTSVKALIAQRVAGITAVLDLGE